MGVGPVSWFLWLFLAILIVAGIVGVIGNVAWLNDISRKNREWLD